MQLFTRFNDILDYYIFSKSLSSFLFLSVSQGSIYTSLIKPFINLINLTFLGTFSIGFLKNIFYALAGTRTRILSMATTNSTPKPQALDKILKYFSVVVVVFVIIYIILD